MVKQIINMVRVPLPIKHEARLRPRHRRDYFANYECASLQCGYSCPVIMFADCSDKLRHDPVLVSWFIELTPRLSEGRTRNAKGDWNVPCMKDRPGAA